MEDPGMPSQKPFSPCLTILGFLRVKASLPHRGALPGALLSPALHVPKRCLLVLAPCHVTSSGLESGGEIQERIWVYPSWSQIKSVTESESLCLLAWMDFLQF